MRAFLCVTTLLLAAGSAEAQRLSAEISMPAAPYRAASRFQATPLPWAATPAVTPAGLRFAAGQAAPRPGAVLRDGSGVAVPLLVGAGILGGAAGLFGGGYLGAYSGSWRCRQDGGECDVPVVWGAILGGITGEALGIPIAEHLAGGRRGAFLAELGVSVLLSGAGLGLLAATHYDQPAAPVILVAVPLAQLAAVTWLEKRGR